MWAVIRRNPLAAFLALVLHLLLAGFLIFGVDWWQDPVRPAAKAPPVQARVIDSQKLLEEQRRKAEAEQRQRDEAKRKAEAEQRKLEEAKRTAAEEERKRKEAERKAAEKERQQEAARKAAADKRRKEEAERKAAEEKRKQEAAQRKAAEEKRKKEEAARKAAEEKRKKQEAERKAAEEKRKRDEAQRKAAEQKAREDALRAQIEAEENAREIELYVGSIKRQIELGWLKPPNTASGLACTLRVRLIPGGEVVPGSVRVVKSSGNERFDRSVEQAVYKASPLRVPSGTLFESFRELTLVFDPD